ncbi:MAG: alanine:cation symporter family protein [Clostridia bacterium]|nr:alanine:cation symporter family protein [Clostridia bacterium]
MEEILLKIAQTINTYLSDYILIFLLVGVGLYYSIRTKFVQVRCFGEGMKNVFGNLKLKGGKQKGGISSFQALATAIAAQVGTGNIVGASGAILVGGPGAIFWMWIIAFLGMATIYAEATLAQKTKVTNDDGTVEGGPIYYIKHAFKGGFGKFLAVFFSIAAVIALGFVGAMVQSNSIAENFASVFNQVGIDGSIAKIVVGVIIAAIAGFVLIGGVQRLASVTEKIVPVMACLYLIGGLIVLGVNITNVPDAFAMIFKYAFAPQAIIGGGIGAALKAAISQGAKRGLFSNEAGMGSTPHAHALANVKDPHTQGTSAMIGVFIDTFVVLTMTALIVISTLYCDGTINPALPGTEGSFIVGDVSKANMVQLAFQKTFAVIFGAEVGGLIGSIFVALCLFFFAFSTILSWNYFGKVNFTHLFGKKSALVYSVIAIVFVFLGSVFQNDLVWELTDMFNNLMVIPNVIALFALGGLVVSMTKFKKSNELPEIKEESTEK